MRLIRMAKRTRLMGMFAAKAGSDCKSTFRAAIRKEAMKEVSV
jgi:hypothetical protein